MAPKLTIVKNDPIINEMNYSEFSFPNDSTMSNAYDIVEKLVKENVINGITIHYQLKYDMKDDNDYVIYYQHEYSGEVLNEEQVPEEDSVILTVPMDGIFTEVMVTYTLIRDLYGEMQRLPQDAIINELPSSTFEEQYEVAVDKVKEKFSDERVFTMLDLIRQACLNNEYFNIVISMMPNEIELGQGIPSVTVWFGKNANPYMFLQLAMNIAIDRLSETYFKSEPKLKDALLLAIREANGDDPPPPNGGIPLPLQKIMGTKKYRAKPPSWQRRAMKRR